MLPAEDQSAQARDEMEPLWTSVASYSGRFGPQLCRFLALLPELGRLGDPGLTREAAIAATYLTRNDADDRTARTLVDDLAYRLGLQHRVPAVHVMAGLACFLVVMAICAYGIGLLWQGAQWQASAAPAGFFIFNVSPWLVIAVGAAGGVGSMVSMFSRLEAYSALAATDVRVLWLLGAVKPIMGVAFALFVFCVLQSRILPFKFEGDAAANFTFLTLAFIAGFSERFSRVVAAKVETGFLGREAAADADPVTTATITPFRPREQRKSPSV
jgi:hypothetical protein